MTKKRKRPAPKASDRIFYTAPRHWKIWTFDWVWTAPALVVLILSAFLGVALAYLP